MNSAYAPSHYNTTVDRLSTHPLMYCMSDAFDTRYQRGGRNDIGPHSRECQYYMPEYCSRKWDVFCEAASRDASGTYYPNAGISSDARTRAACRTRTLTYGEKLIYTTAQRKYLVQMYGAHARVLYEPFDSTVADSPMITYWTGARTPVYAITDPSALDADPVMTKLLDDPSIAPDILLNIYNTMKRHGTLHTLRGTRLARHYAGHPMVYTPPGEAGASV